MAVRNEKVKEKNANNKRLFGFAYSKNKMVVPAILYHKPRTDSNFVEFNLVYSKAIR